MSTEVELEELRSMIGETLPEGGSEADSLFSDEQLTRWINNTSSLEQAALTGWRRKMAHFANLVTVVDGAASREMTELLNHAKEMVKEYSVLAQGPTAGRSRVGKIIRS